MEDYKNRLYRFVGAGTGDRAVGKGTATYDSIMLCSAISEQEKVLFNSWAETANFGDRKFINDIEFMVATRNK